MSVSLSKCTCESSPLDPCPETAAAYREYASRYPLQNDYPHVELNHTYRPFTFSPVLIRCSY